MFHFLKLSGFGQAGGRPDAELTIFPYKTSPESGHHPLRILYRHHTVLRTKVLTSYTILSVV